MKHRNLVKSMAVMLAMMIVCTTGYSQKAFQAGEVLNYNLYYNWKFIWVKAGSATMSIARTIYGETPAYRARLLTRGSETADNYFVLRDTITSIMKADGLQPLYYLKNDVEGSSHRRREAWYSYQGNACRVKQHYTHKDGRLTRRDETLQTQVYDMLSILLKARTFETSSWKPGKKITFQMTDGNGIAKQTLIYRGKQNIKIKGSSTTYRCLQLSFVEYREGKEEEVITFFVTDDANHIPVRLDMYLRFGSAKAFLVGSRGLKNPIRAQVK